MAETIGSLGGVALGRSGTGRAVTFGKEDYSYLGPDKNKEEKYKPLVPDSEISKLLRDSGSLWRPDQQEGKQKADQILTKIKEIELENKTGDKTRAMEMREDLRRDIIDFQNFYKNSKDQEKNGVAFSNDREKNPLLYDDSDEATYQEWLSKPVAERSLDVPVARANDLNYIKYIVPTMEELMNPATYEETKIVGGIKDTDKNVYYTDAQIKDAAMKSARAIPVKSKYMNWWKASLMSFPDDPTTPENEKELATEVLSTIGPDGTSDRLYEFIGNQNYKLFLGNKSTKTERITPYTPPKSGAGGSTRQPTVALTTSLQDVYSINPTTGVESQDLGSYPTVGIGEDKDSQLSYIVSDAYVKGYLNSNRWAQKVFQRSSSGGPSEYVVKGDAVAVYYDPNTNKEYIKISTKVDDAYKVIVIPMTVENEATLESKYKKTGEQGTFKEYRNKYYESTGRGTPGGQTQGRGRPAQSGSRSTTPARTQPRQATTPRTTGGTPPPARGGRRGTWNPTTGQIE